MPGSAMRRKARSSVSKLVECGLDLNQPGRQRCQSSGKGNGTSGVFQNYSGLKYDIEFQHTVHNCWLLLIVSGNSWPSHWNAVHLGLVCPVSIQSQSRVQHLWWTAPPLTDLRHPKPTPWGSKSTNGHWWLSLRTRFIISNLRNRNGIYIYIIYLENHKDKIFCPYGFGHFFCPLRVISKYGHVRLQTLYLQVNLVNSFPELLDLSDWFRQYECLV